MSPYEASDQAKQDRMLLGFWILVGCVGALALGGAALAGGEAYQLWTNPPTYCVPSYPRI